MNYNFEWDPGKATSNRRKHGVSFEQAATVFRDQRALSVFDTEHSGAEDRWMTLGVAAGDGLLVVHHTFEELDRETVRIRVFSARSAAKKEIRQYGE